MKPINFNEYTRLIKEERLQITTNPIILDKIEKL